MVIGRNFRRIVFNYLEKKKKKKKEEYKLDYSGMWTTVSLSYGSFDREPTISFD